MTSNLTDSSLARENKWKKKKKKLKNEEKKKRKKKQKKLVGSIRCTAVQDCFYKVTFGKWVSLLFVFSPHPGQSDAVETQ